MLVILFRHFKCLIVVLIFCLYSTFRKILSKPSATYTPFHKKAHNPELISVLWAFDLCWQPMVYSVSIYVAVVRPAFGCCGPVFW
jgi:hypothetical protein